MTTFDNKTLQSPNEEFVSMIEGVVYPWFGTAYRIDRIQFSMEKSSVDLVDHSREAISHALLIGNLFVDESRLSPNRYRFVIDEIESVDLIQSNDLYQIRVPVSARHPEILIRSEVYFF